MINNMATALLTTGSRLVSCAMLVVCLCVLIQMLGVPVTLLDPVRSVDSMESSGLEGFSLLSCTPEAPSAAPGVPVAQNAAVSHALVLAAVLFHPPVH